MNKWMCPWPDVLIEDGQEQAYLISSTQACPDPSLLLTGPVMPGPGSLQEAGGEENNDKWHLYTNLKIYKALYILQRHLKPKQPCEVIIPIYSWGHHPHSYHPHF